MEYIKKLQEYLISDKNDKKGYLLKDISKGRVLMLSGLWGSGKTYFWQEKIVKDKNVEKSNVYISLYGKSSILDIEKEVLVKSYCRSLGRKNEEKDLVEKLYSTFTSTPKVLDSIINTDIDKLIKEFNSINDSQKDKKAEKFINDGLIICFDDFERKSTKINLQDLFGFITNLSIQFKARIIIILNSDVFKNEDEKIFTNLKEKSVSKYITFTPKCSELFELIFNIEEKLYKEKLDNHKEILKNTFKEVNIINARIMLQVLDNILEWVDNEKHKDNDTIRLLVLVNINFILNHQVYVASKDEIRKNETPYFGEDYKSSPPIENESYILYRVKQNNNTQSSMANRIDKYINSYFYNEKIIENVKESIASSNESFEDKQVLASYVDSNSFYIKSIQFMNYFKLNKSTEYNKETIEIFNKINDFIETGML